MQIVINILKEVYDHVLKAKSTPDVLGIDIVNVINAVKNGRPLPKGHGDLIDRKKLQNNIDDKDLISPKDISKIQTLRKWINNQNPIIEADKTESE